MKIIGLMVCRNDAWVLPASIAAAQCWVDGLVVLMHACEDRTSEIVGGFNGICPLSESSPSWDEADFRGRMLATGRQLGGTHFAIIDSDEILCVPAMNQIRGDAEKLNPGEVLRIPWIHCWRSLNQYRCDHSVFGTARVPFLFADSPELTYSPDPDGYQLHHRAPRGTRSKPVWQRDEGMGVLHLQHAVWDRVYWKQRNYVLQEQLRWGSVRANYAGTLNETGLQLRDVPREWWPVDPALIDMHAEPWQREECDRLIAYHGREKFAGLPLWD